MAWPDLPDPDILRQTYYSAYTPVSDDTEVTVNDSPSRLISSHAILVHVACRTDHYATSDVTQFASVYFDTNTMFRVIWVLFPIWVCLPFTGFMFARSPKDWHRFEYCVISTNNSMRWRERWPVQGRGNILASAVGSVDMRIIIIINSISLISIAWLTTHHCRLQ